MKKIGTGAEVGNGNLLGEPNDGVANLFHDTADGATRFVRTGTFLVELFADATDGSEGAFDVANDFGEGNIFGFACELVASGKSAAALDEAGGFQVEENLLQKTLGDVLFPGDLRNADDAGVIVQAENEHRAKRVFTSD